MKLLDKILVKVGWPFARLFVAGKIMEDAFRVAKKLNEQGLEAIINFLGEEVKDRKQAQENVRVYIEILRQIYQQKLKARVSVKPSQLGLKINRDFYWHNLWEVGRRAFNFEISLEIDIETEDTVEAIIQATIEFKKYFTSKFFGTIDLRQAVAMNFKKSFTYLYNLTAADVGVRLCKGAYPSRYSEKEVKQRYFHAASWLLRMKTNPDFATHDLRLLDRIFLLRNEYPSVCGFQFLLGLRKKKWKELSGKGERVAVYVPFGKNWLPYAKRRWKYIIKKIPSMICGN
jgi:proline dehydrogenase